MSTSSSSDRRCPELVIEIRGNTDMEIVRLNQPLRKPSRATQTSPADPGCRLRLRRILEQPVVPCTPEVSSNLILPKHSSVTASNNTGDAEAGLNGCQATVGDAQEHSSTTASVSRVPSFLVDKYRLNKNQAKNIDRPVNTRDEQANNMATPNPLASQKSGETSKLHQELAELDRALERVRLVNQKAAPDGERTSLEWEQDIFEKRRIIPRMGTRLSDRKPLFKKSSNAEILSGGLHGWKKDVLSFPGDKYLETAEGDNVTSAYNTADSSCSTPLTISDNSEIENRCEISLERDDGISLGQNLDDSFFRPEYSQPQTNGNHTLQTSAKGIHVDNKKFSDFSEKINRKDSVNEEVTCKLDVCKSFEKETAEELANHIHALPNDHATRPTNCDRDERHVTHASLNSNFPGRETSAAHVDVMYTNWANLEHTIMIQQTLFEQRMRRIGKERSKISQTFADAQKCENQASAIGRRESAADDTANNSNVNRASAVAMEWVVKRRTDGSRYISRRPAKRCRPRKHPNDCRNLPSTDDEAFNDVNVGRCRSREERRRRQRTARIHCQNKETTVGERTGEEGRADGMTGLDHCRKVMAGRPRIAFDVRETNCSRRSGEPLLAVTTI